MPVSSTALSSSPPARTVLPVVATERLRVSLITDGPGMVEAPAQAGPKVVIHVGRPVRMVCTHGDERQAGVALHGDVDIVPGGVPSSWELGEADTALVLCPAAEYVRALAEAEGLDARRLSLRSRFRVRDPQLEHIGWALLAEADRGFPSGALYVESLAAALTARLLRGHGSASGNPGWAAAGGGLGARKLRLVAAYVEEHLGGRLSLESAAAVAGLSASHFKAQFRRAAGLPFHQYVIRQRVERAAGLLRSGRASISEAALEAGFCHASHLAAQMRRVLGLRPRQLAAESARRRPRVRDRGGALAAR